MTFERIVLVVIALAIIVGGYLLISEMGKSEFEKEMSRCESLDDNPYSHRVLFCEDDVRTRYGMEY